MLFSVSALVERSPLTSKMGPGTRDVLAPPFVLDPVDVVPLDRWEVEGGGPRFGAFLPEAECFDAQVRGAHLSQLCSSSLCTDVTSQVLIVI